MCRERFLECDTDDEYDTHRECCRTAVCYLCIEFDCDGDLYTGQANWDGVSAYSGTAELGTADEIDFHAYWEKRGGECVFVVELDGYEAATFSKCDGSYAVECRDPAGEFFYEHTQPDGYSCEGTFQFFVRKDKRLRRRWREDGHCTTYFCGASDCTCEKLCVNGIVVNYDESEYCQIVGRLDWADYDDCEKGTLTPQWTGNATCTGFDVSEQPEFDIYLGRDEYDQCVMFGTVTFNGITVELDEAEVLPEPSYLSVSWSDLEFGDKTMDFALSCSLCGECGTVSVDCCAEPLPRQIYAIITADAPLTIPYSDDCECTNGEYLLTFSEFGPPNRFAGWWSEELAWPCSNTSVAYWQIGLFCLGGVWNAVVSLYDSDDVLLYENPVDSPTGTCDPFDLDFGCGLNLFNSQCLGMLQPNTVCLEFVE